MQYIWRSELHPFDVWLHNVPHSYGVSSEHRYVQNMHDICQLQVSVTVRMYSLDQFAMHQVLCTECSDAEGIICVTCISSGHACMQISPAGHCPHHEAPTAVHEAMVGWLQAVETSGALPWAVGEQWQHQTVTVTHVNGSPRNIFEKVDVLWYAFKKRFLGKRPL